MSIRNWLYKLAARSGDVNAASKGKVVQRVVRKSVAKHIHHATNKVFRKLFK